MLILILSLGLLLIACGDDTVYHTVKFDTNGGPAMQSVAIKSGNVLSKPEDPVWAGYDFLGWYMGETLWDFETSTVTADVTLKAKWKRVTYTVSFNSDGGTAISSQAIGSGDHASEPLAPHKDGCIFKGWYVGDTAWSFEESQITEDVTLTAKWERITYTVSFDSDGGNKVEPITVAHGDPVTAPVPPTKENNKFLGWYFGDKLWDFENNKITSDITLKAKWETQVVTHEVCFDAGGDELYRVDHVVNGEKLTPPVPPTHSEFIFVGWYIGAVEFDFENTPVTEPLYLTAKWKEKSAYVITFDTQGGSAVEPIFVLEGDTITAPVSTKYNQRLVHWEYNGKVWDFDTPPTSDMTLVARWEVDLPIHRFGN